ncbi:MAG: sugar phosphate isomerase/epimerase [Chloroflexota bacterium]
MRPDQIAVQLYTLRAETASDLPGTLRKVAAAGYRAVELAGLPPIEPEALRDLLSAGQLRPIASHESLESLRSDLDAVLDRLTVVGCPLVIVPWLPDAERITPRDVRRLAGELGEIARTCAGRGFRLGYHNHAFEFAPLDGTTVWDVLLDALPLEIELEVDVYWAAIGGRDPVEVIRDAGERVRLLHMKDMSPQPDRGDVTPGDGTLPWREIVEAGTRLNVEWYVVEEDNPRDAIVEITRGLDYLGGLASTDARA